METPVFFAQAAQVNTLESSYEEWKQGSPKLVNGVEFALESSYEEWKLLLPFIVQEQGHFS